VTEILEKVRALKGKLLDRTLQAIVDHPWSYLTEVHDATFPVRFELSCLVRAHAQLIVEMKHAESVWYALSYLAQVQASSLQ